MDKGSFVTAGYSLFLLVGNTVQSPLIVRYIQPVPRWDNYVIMRCSPPHLWDTLSRPYSRIKSPFDKWETISPFSWMLSPVGQLTSQWVPVTPLSGIQSPSQGDTGPPHSEFNPL